MAVFAYRAQNSRGQRVEGQIEAAEESEAITKVQSQGLLVLQVRPVDSSKNILSAKGSLLSLNLPFMEGKPSGSEMIFVAEQLALLIKGGVPILQGLKLLAENVSSPVLRRALLQVVQDVSGGASLSGGLKRHPKVFSDIWFAIVESGESAGQLPKALEELSNYLNQRDILRTKIVTAFFYPAIMMGMSAFVLFFFVFKIIPIFTEIFESFHIKLPVITVIVVQISKFLTANLLLIAGIIFALIVAIRAFFATDRGQWAKGKLVLKLPFFGGFIANIMIERLLTNFALLLRSDVDVIRSLALMEKFFTENRIFANTMAVARQKIQGGGTIAQGFSQTKTLPPLAVQVIRLGEESGKLPQMLETLAAYYKRQIDIFVQRLSSVIDPIMICIVGMIVTVLVLSIFMPIFELSQMKLGK